ncbi:MAG TPA: restriction endonuclease subunit S [Blastocatellia bacterium]|nr:restriction endonuclease subunit S [Blastocatellia bacterium]
MIDLNSLKVNPDWASLPLFERTGWARVRFGDVVANLNETERNPGEAGIDRFIGLEHLEPGSLHVSKWGNVADGTTFTRRCRPGQVLFGKRRAYQRKVAVAEFDAVVSGDIYVLAPKNRLIRELLPFLCLSERFFQHAVGTSAGSLSPRTNWSSLASFEFDLPPVEQQRFIAEILCVADEFESKSWHLHKELTGFFQSLASDLFCKLALRQNSFVKLTEVLARQPQSGIYKGPMYVGRGVKTVNMAELFGNEVIDRSVSMQRMDLSTDEVRKYSLTPHDLLFGRRSIVLEGAGKCSMVGALDEPTAFESSILRVTVDPEKVSSRFVFEWFNSPNGSKEIRRIRSFTTIAGISGSALRSVRVPLPQGRRQAEIVQKLGEVRSAHAAIAQELIEAGRLKTGLIEALLGATNVV